MNRRDFLRRASALSAGAASAAPLLTPLDARATTALSSTSVAKDDVREEGGQAPSSRTPLAAQASTTPTGRETRAIWLQALHRLADPVLTHLSNGTLKQSMPVEAAAGAEADRRRFSHLEAFGRLLAGIAPWLDLPADESEEGRARTRMVDLARRALARATDPSSPDFLNFVDGGQALVDTAFLAQAILRAPRVLWETLDPAARPRVIAALEATRVHQPGFNNWLLFSATVEAALRKMGARWDRMRVDYALRQHDQWYKGDGQYGDGPELHWDYYNSFVIQPMLVDVLRACATENAAWTRLQPIMEARARRYAAIQERLIAPDGSFPAIGRSLAYRAGAFQTLAQSALLGTLPEEITPGQARRALTRVLQRTLDAPGTFDTGGWLRIGLCGHQPDVGETYISTGSLYLCSVSLLPLGLPADAPFWSEPEGKTTAERAWSGERFPIDHALRNPSA